MKCLTVQQPWAWMILHAGKRIENRSWPTKYRGPLLIHAVKARHLMRVDPSYWRGTYGVTLAPDEYLVFGAIVGQVQIIDCLPLEEVPLNLRTRFADGPFCWLLDESKTFDCPIPYTGRLGLFDVPENVLNESLRTPSPLPAGSARRIGSPP